MLFDEVDAAVTLRHGALDVLAGDDRGAFNRGPVGRLPDDVGDRPEADRELVVVVSQPHAFFDDAADGLAVQGREVLAPGDGGNEPGVLGDLEI